MKTYKITLSAKILLTAIFLLSIALGIYSLFDKDLPLVGRLLGPPLIVFFIFGTYILNNYKVIVDNEKIEVTPLFLPNTGILFWKDICTVTSFYFLFPETGMIHLIAKRDSGKKIIQISLVGGLPIGLIHDILSHLPPDIKIYLYPYLKRKAEGKQTWFYKK